MIAKVLSAFLSKTGQNKSRSSDIANTATTGIFRAEQIYNLVT
jgi:hypothetical protein